MNLECMADKVIHMYQVENKNTVEIAAEIGASSSGVGRLLVRHGIKPSHTPNELRLSDEQIESICRLYQAGSTTIELADKYGVCDASIAKVLRENGVEVRRAARRSPVSNHAYFEKIDCPEKAYFLGWMVSDGAVVESHTRPDSALRISIEIHTRDKYILEKFADELGANRLIVRDNSRGHSYMRFSSNKMASDLSQYGVVPRKSWVATLPRIDDELMPHLLRGIFDGNGTVTASNGYIRFAFYGSKAICDSINHHLNEVIDLNLNTVGKSTCYHIWWGGDRQAMAFARYIYRDAGTYYLKRKRERFERYL